ncbi:MAG: ester cyclase, partial [Anaerolineae bacterium]|nr:ester cyclase [Anaerolineae bacterium]
MSIESNKAVVRRFREALAAGDVEEAFAVFAPDAVIHMGSAPEPLSMEGFKQMGQLLLSAFSASSSTVEAMIAEGDLVVSRITFRGTHTGDMMGIPPTGKSVAMSEIII